MLTKLGRHFKSRLNGAASRMTGKSSPASPFSLDLTPKIALLRPHNPNPEIKENYQPYQAPVPIMVNAIHLNEDPFSNKMPHKIPKRNGLIFLPRHLEVRRSGPSDTTDPPPQLVTAKLR
jgi:hypothetical protein